VWLWLALAASLLYFPLIFWSQGYVTPTQGVWWRFHMHSRRDMGDPRRQGRVSRAMIMHVSYVSLSSPIADAATVPQLRAGILLASSTNQPCEVFQVIM
jgi:hypothetical protein